MFALGGDFSDIDHFSEVTRSWHLDFFQLDRGALEASLFQLGTPSFQLAEARFSRTLEQHGVAPTGMRTFAIPATPFLQLRWRNIEITSEHLMIFPRGGELYSVSQPGFHVYTCSIREEALLSRAEQLGHPLVADSLDQSNEAVRVRPQAMASLVAECRGMIARFRNSPSVPASTDGDQRQLEDRLIARLIEALATSSTEPSSPAPPVRRARLIGKVRDFVHDRDGRKVTVTQLCRATGVSARTLQYAFRDEFDMSPKSWLQARSLSGVRRDLRRAHSSHAKVADIANAWGFWHMGQFARDYRRMFDELPSGTLSRPPASKPG